MIEIMIGAVLKGLFWFVLMPIFLLAALSGWPVFHFVLLLVVLINALLEALFTAFGYLSDCSDAFEDYLKGEEK
ncbi:MAG: hypothetical protein COC24_019325 [Alphaproteobacteria bacterium]|nr:hypothetical protein [Alphaproteobacteria bacterium]